jgi:hypothetical protein
LHLANGGDGSGTYSIESGTQLAAAQRTNTTRTRDSPWIKSLAEVRQRATREGYCYQHVQAITVAIDQYAEKALGNRDYFLHKPYGVG